MAEPLVTVRGEASLQGPPDLATLAVTVHRSGSSAEKVRAELAHASAQVAAVVEPHREALESSSTSGLHVAPVLPRGEIRRTSYRGSWLVSLVVRDFAALSPLVTALSTQTGMQIDGPWWSLAPDNPMPRQARLAAIDDARRRAEDYAAAFAATLVDVQEVSDLEGAPGGPAGRAFALARGGGEAQPAFDFEPAVQTVTGHVTVRFVMSPPVLDAPAPVGGVPAPAGSPYL